MIPSPKTFCRAAYSIIKHCNDFENMPRYPKFHAKSTLFFTMQPAQEMIDGNSAVLDGLGGL
jgi:hypothetical protein